VHKRLFEEQLAEEVKQWITVQPLLGAGFERTALEGVRECNLFLFKSKLEKSIPA
jgi:hypothetical protein